MIDDGYVDYFQILKIAPDAKPGEVRTSYKQLMKDLVMEIARIEITEERRDRYLLDSVHTVLERAANFVWRTHRTVVSLIDKVYDKGITLRSTEKKTLEKRLVRSDALPWWDVTIKPKMVF